MFASHQQERRTSRRVGATHSVSDNVNGQDDDTKSTNVNSPSLRRAPRNVETDSFQLNDKNDTKASPFRRQPHRACKVAGEGPKTTPKSSNGKSGIDKDTLSSVIVPTIAPIQQEKFKTTKEIAPSTPRAPNEEPFLDISENQYDHSISRQRRQLAQLSLSGPTKHDNAVNLDLNLYACKTLFHPTLATLEEDVGGIIPDPLQLLTQTNGDRDDGNTRAVDSPPNLLDELDNLLSSGEDSGTSPLLATEAFDVSQLTKLEEPSDEDAFLDDFFAFEEKDFETFDQAAACSGILSTNKSETAKFNLSSKPTDKVSPVKPAPSNDTDTSAKKTTNPKVNTAPKSKHWTGHEDLKLQRAILYEGKEVPDWDVIASKYFNETRSPMQCKMRWNRVRISHYAKDFRPDELFSQHPTMHSAPSSWSDLQEIFSSRRQFDSHTSPPRNEV